MRAARRWLSLNWWGAGPLSVVVARTDWVWLLHHIPIPGT